MRLFENSNLKSFSFLLLLCHNSHRATATATAGLKENLFQTEKRLQFLNFFDFHGFYSFEPFFGFSFCKVKTPNQSPIILSAPPRQQQTDRGGDSWAVMAESMTLNKKSVDGNNTITVPHFKVFDEAPVTMHRSNLAILPFAKGPPRCDSQPKPCIQTKSSESSRAFCAFRD
jgi:hypothetical protein